MNAIASERIAYLPFQFTGFYPVGAIVDLIPILYKWTTNPVLGSPLMRGAAGSLGACSAILQNGSEADGVIGRGGKPMVGAATRGGKMG